MNFPLAPDCILIPSYLQAFQGRFAAGNPYAAAATQQQLAAAQAGALGFEDQAQLLGYTSIPINNMTNMPVGVKIYSKVCDHCVTCLTVCVKLCEARPRLCV